MRYLKKLLWLLLPLAIAITIAGCENGFEELQVNPNGPTSINPEFLFTESVVKFFEDDRLQVVNGVNTMMVWTQMLASMDGVQEAGPYAFGQGTNSDLWSRMYVGVLAPAQEVIRLTEGDTAMANIQATARIWRAYIFQRMTDLYGPIPYSEALRASDPSGSITNPAYDDGLAIYTDLLQELREAELQFRNGLPDMGAADPIYNGSIEQWIRFSRSLRLRMAVRIHQAAPELAADHLPELLALESELIDEESERADFPYNDATWPPIYRMLEGGQNLHRGSDFLIELLESTEDPRLRAYFQEADWFSIAGGEQWLGVPNLLDAQQLGDDYGEVFTCDYTDFVNRNDLPGLLITEAEVSFLLAELAARGIGGSQSAETYFERGVIQAMSLAGVPADSATTYLANNPYAGLDDIHLQRYLSLSLRDGFEAFAIWRRTGIPVLTDLDDNPVNAAAIPKRLPYPDSELILNQQNVEAVGFGINDFQTPIWWMP
jgi:hypothetical protein